MPIVLPQRFFPDVRMTAPVADVELDKSGAVERVLVEGAA